MHAQTAVRRAGTGLCRAVAVLTCLAAAVISDRSVRGEETDAPEARIGAVQLDVRLGNGCRFEVARKGDLVLGLRKASVGGVELKTDRTIQRPVLAQEWDRDRMIWPLLRFKDARQNGKGVEIVCELLGTSDEKAFRSFFVGDQDRKPLAQVERHRAYRVQSDDLLKSFGVRRGPLPDPRIGRKYDPPKFTWPAWTREPAATQSSPAEPRETGKGGAQ